MYENRLFDVEDLKISDSDKNEVNRIILDILLDISKLLEKAEAKIDQIKNQSSESESFELKILKIKASTYDAIDDLILNIV